MSDTGKSFVKLPARYRKGDVILVKSILKHPQHTGRGKDKETGKVIPALYITRVEVFYLGKLITSIDGKPSLSKDPFFAFKVRVADSGTLAIVWKDNRGAVYENSVEIKV